MRIGRAFYPERTAFTLIELLVVMGILLLIVTVGFVVFPRRAERDMTFAASRLQSWLLSARSQAKRDNKATGIRFQIGTNNGVASTTSSMFYIQQPDPFPAPNIATTCGTIGAGPPFSTLGFAPPGMFQGNAAFAGQQDLAPVEIGDYIYLPNASTQLCNIASVTASSVTIQPALTAAWSSSVANPYQVLRRPRPLLGEEDLTLPSDIVIDFNTMAGLGTPNSAKSTVPFIGPPASVYEILFSPAGNVIGQNSSSSQIFLWLTNTDWAGSNNMTQDTTQSLIIAIQVRTGLVGVNPVGQPPTAAAPLTPYSFALSGRSSGM